MANVRKEERPAEEIEQSLQAAKVIPSGEEQAENLARRHRRRVRALRSFIFRTVSLVIVLYVLFFHIVGVTIAPSRDMYPRVDIGDLLLYYRLEKNIKAQDVIVIDKDTEEDTRTGERGFLRKALDWLGFKDPEAPETQRYVCRVIGAPGDTVEITDENGLMINGNHLIESNIFYPTKPYEEGVTEYPLKLGEGEYFVMADQRNGGTDSRYFGVVKAKEIQGVVITILRRTNL